MSIRERLKNCMSRAELEEIAYDIEELISTKELLKNIIQALDSDTLKDTLDWIARQFDLDYE